MCDKIDAFCGRLRLRNMHRAAADVEHIPGRSREPRVRLTHALAIPVCTELAFFATTARGVPRFQGRLDGRRDQGFVQRRARDAERERAKSRRREYRFPSLYRSPSLSYLATRLPNVSLPPFPPLFLAFFFYFSSRTMHQEESRGGEPSPGVERCLSILEVRPPLIPYSTLSLPLELLIFPSGIYLSGKSCCI